MPKRPKYLLILSIVLALFVAARSASDTDTQEPSDSADQVTTVTVVGGSTSAWRRWRQGIRVRGCLSQVHNEPQRMD